MYLRALEIQGFKSFPDKTRLTFEKDITAIVGPNGSGKSNISDAILWVMGEQRSKALRGGKMEDVIFGGTEKRPKMGFAQVSLVIDNTQRIFETDSTEVMITRRYYRSGESEYYINRETVRLKDITELLMDTGLGRYGYSIIGQGRISEVVSAKSGDRRELFEEAAGISRYRYRKDESERKLLHTDENLVRINDKIDELKIQVEPLREQAETAKKYLILRDELRLLEVSVWMETLDKLHEKAAGVTADWERAKTELAQAHEQLEELYAATEGISEKMREKDIQAEGCRSRLSQAESVCGERDSRLAVLKNSADHIDQRRRQLLSEIDEQGGRAAALEQQILQRVQRIEQIALEIEALDGELAKLSTAADENLRSGDAERLEAQRLITEKSDVSAGIARCTAVISTLGDSGERQQQLDRQLSQQLEQTAFQQQQLESRLLQDKAAAAEAAEKLKELDNIISGYQLRLESREKRVKTLEEQNTAFTIELSSVKSRLNMLSEMEKEFEGYSKAVKTVMRESGRGTLKGISGPVANLVKTEDRFTLAIETALGGSMQSIVVDNQEQGKAAIELLKRQDAGRATFLPVSTIKGSSLGKNLSGQEGFLGTALELCSFDGRFEGIFSNLLGRTAVAETLGDAVKMSSRFENQLRIVTLDGQLINPGGSMTGGSAAKNAGILSRANELKTLREKLGDVEEQAQKCQTQLSEASRELAGVKYELQTAGFEQGRALENKRSCQNAQSSTEIRLEEIGKALGELNSRRESAKQLALESEKQSLQTRSELEALEQEQKRLDGLLETINAGSAERQRQSREFSEKLSAMAEKRSSLTAEADTGRDAAEQLRQLLQDITGDSESRKEAIAQLEQENNSLQQQMSQLSELLEQGHRVCEEIKQELTELNQKKLELEGKRTQNEKKAQEKNRELLDAERLSASIEQKILASEMEEKQIVDKLWDSYELSRSAAQAVRQPMESLAASTKKIGSLRREITSLGTPNLGAIEEYDRVSTRYNFLTEQRDDVEKAKAELEKIIADITGEMKEIFLSEFKAIDEGFRTTFLELFGGGRAALVLEDPEDVLNCGIEIKVQPPGKALSTLSLLSGGEMAFVAIALYFAIIKVRPTPFCVMDEIEAALDEANVGKYAQYMRRLTDKTQFIIITHRRGTMEEADILYGVTMQEKGVSQVISVDLDEAEKAIAN